MSLELLSEPIPLATDMDGVVRVGNMRVTLHTVIAAFTDGATAEEIAQQYPALPLADVYGAISYYLRHHADVDQYLRRRGQQAAKVRTENESRHNPAGIRERLLARRDATKSES